MRTFTLICLLLAACETPTEPLRDDASMPGLDAAGLDTAGLDAGGLDAAGLDVPRAPRDAPTRDAGDLSDLSAMERTLVDMPAGTWLRVDAGYDTVCEASSSDEWRAVGGCGGLTAYSGGVWDSEHRWMLLWGGGHNDYAGNEVYAFSTQTFTWTRLGPPSAGPYDRDVLTDGRPVSRHTYDGLTFLPGSGRMWSVGGARAFDGNATSLVWTYDPLTDTFENDTRAATQPIHYESSAVYDPVSARVYVKSGEAFYIFDPATGAVETPFDFGSPPYWPRYAGGVQTAALDTQRRLIFFMGGDLYMVYDIDGRRFVTDDWITSGGSMFDNRASIGDREGQNIVTGGGEIISARNPGIDYDVHADQLVAWTGRALWELDLASQTWTALPMDGAPVAPADPRFEQTHIYGRFRYLDRMNVFILIEGRDAVWFYKHTAGG